MSAPDLRAIGFAGALPAIVAGRSQPLSTCNWIRQFWQFDNCPPHQLGAIVGKRERKKRGFSTRHRLGITRIFNQQTGKA
ncbi:MAG: hypothetical protein ACP5D7_19235 [Limnospira sp.]